MNSHEMISVYEAVAATMEEMLAAARNADWDQLALLETRCASHIATLKKDSEPAPLTSALREQKVEIIKKILADDREIRSITEPWMKRLSLMINSTGMERKLVQAYDSTPSR